MPRGVDIEVVELMHRTHMGVDQDYNNLIKQSSRCALADGWGGSMITTDLQDIMFGCPTPVAGEINLGVLKEDHVNVVMHGHEPLLPEMLVVASQEPEMIQYAQNKGAKGIQLAGMCCSANEIMMRHGVPVAGNYLHQELAHHHRRGGRHGGGRAVRDAVPGQRGQPATTPRSSPPTAGPRSKSTPASSTSTLTSTTPWTWPGRCCASPSTTTPTARPR